MAGLPVHIPEGQRVSLAAVVEETHLGNALGNLALRGSGCSQATQIAFDIGSKHTDPGITEAFDQALQGHGLAGAGGSGDQPMTIAQAQALALRLAIGTRAQQQLGDFFHLVFLWVQALLNSNR